MAKQLKKRIGPQFRPIAFDRAKVDEKKRTIEIAFSSEEPVERWWGVEILGHAQGECDLSRLNNAAPLLLDHDQRTQIGVVESASIDQDKRGRAIVRFGNSPKANEIFQDVVDGIRTKVSVGYSIERMLLEEIDGDPSDEEDDATYRAVEWLPYELSLVSIPADDTVGVGRDRIESCHPETIIELSPTFSNKMKRTHPLLDVDPPNNKGGGSETKSKTEVGAPAVIDAARTNEKTRVRELLTIGTRFRRVKEANDAIESDMSVDAFRAKVMDSLENNPSPAGPDSESSRAIQLGGGSIGELFVQSQSYQRFLKGFNGGAGAEKQTINFMAEVGKNVRDLRLWLARATYEERAVATSSGLTSIQKLPEVVALGVVPLRVADLLMPGETGNTTIRYIQESSFTNAADAVAENAAIPEMVWALAEVDAPVKKIGTIGRVSDELFADYPAVRDYIDRRLSYAVGIKEDSELLNGSNVGAHIKGLLNFTGIQTQAVGANTVVDACYKAMVKVRTIGWAEPSGWVLHPDDWKNIKLTKDTNGQYLFGGPSFGPYGQGQYTGPGMLWGKPVVETTSIAQGTGFCGAFNQDSQLFRRLGLILETTNSDASDFANNRTAIRATERLALACYRPASFCTVTGIPVIP